MNILDKIIARKKEEILAAKAKTPEAVLRERAEKPREKRPFLERLKRTETVNIIAEIKRASPSKGDICLDLDPAEYARAYEKGGAAAMSVLTDSDFFKGGWSDYETARKSCALPALRKDFVVSSYQLYESAALGVDAALLIVRVLSQEQLKTYLDLCRQLNLDALVETHTEEEIEAAGLAGAQLVGINNRNLGSFETDIQTSARMISLIQPEQVAVAESGIHTASDIEKLKSAGFNNFLIGESIVRSGNPADFLRELIGEQ